MAVLETNTEYFSVISSLVNFPSFNKKQEQKKLTKLLSRKIKLVLLLNNLVGVSFMDQMLGFTQSLIIVLGHYPTGQFLSIKHIVIVSVAKLAEGLTFMLNPVRLLGLIINILCYIPYKFCKKNFFYFLIWFQ